MAHPDSRWTCLPALVALLACGPGAGAGDATDGATDAIDSAASAEVLNEAVAGLDSADASDSTDTAIYSGPDLDLECAFSSKLNASPLHLQRIHVQSFDGAWAVQIGGMWFTWAGDTLTGAAVNAPCNAGTSTAIALNTGVVSADHSSIALHLSADAAVCAGLDPEETLCCRDFHADAAPFVPPASSPCVFPAAAPTQTVGGCEVGSVQCATGCKPDACRVSRSYGQNCPNGPGEPNTSWAKSFSVAVDPTDGNPCRTSTTCDSCVGATSPPVPDGTVCRGLDACGTCSAGECVTQFAPIWELTTTAPVTEATALYPNTVWSDGLGGARFLASGNTFCTAATGACIARVSPTGVVQKGDILPGSTDGVTACAPTASPAGRTVCIGGGHLYVADASGPWQTVQGVKVPWFAKDVQDQLGETVLIVEGNQGLIVDLANPGATPTTIEDLRQFTDPYTMLACGLAVDKWILSVQRTLGGLIRLDATVESDWQGCEHFMTGECSGALVQGIWYRNAPHWIAANAQGGWLAASPLVSAGCTASSPQHPCPMLNAYYGGAGIVGASAFVAWGGVEAAGGGSALGYWGDGYGIPGASLGAYPTTEAENSGVHWPFVERRDLSTGRIQTRTVFRRLGTTDPRPQYKRTRVHGAMLTTGGVLLQLGRGMLWTDAAGQEVGHAVLPLKFAGSRVHAVTADSVLLITPTGMARLPFTASATTCP